jgi:hypothetical protein
MVPHNQVMVLVKQISNGIFQKIAVVVAEKDPE